MTEEDREKERRHAFMEWQKALAAAVENDSLAIQNPDLRDLYAFNASLARVTAISWEQALKKLDKEDGAK